MNEDVTEMLESDAETLPGDTESGLSDSSAGENNLESDSNSGGDSVDSDGVELPVDAIELPEETEETEETEKTEETEETEETEDIKPVIQFPDALNLNVESLIDEELGGVPVVDITAVSEYAGVGGTSYQLPSYYVDYFSGVLDNIGDTDYLAFCTREYPYNNDYWVEHYRLVYELDIDGDSVVSGTYPCLDIYRYSSSSNYNVDSTTYTLSSVPAFSYGSFGLYSDLRKGVTHDETWAVLFFLGFFTVYSICRSIFDTVQRLRR